MQENMYKHTVYLQKVIPPFTKSTNLKILPILPISPIKKTEKKLTNLTDPILNKQFRRHNILLLH